MAMMYVNENILSTVVTNYSDQSTGLGFLEGELTDLYGMPVNVQEAIMDFQKGLLTFLDTSQMAQSSKAFKYLSQYTEIGWLQLAVEYCTGRTAWNTQLAKHGFIIICSGRFIVLVMVQITNLAFL